MPPKKKTEQSDLPMSKPTNPQIIKTETFLQGVQNGQPFLQGSNGHIMKKKRAQSLSPTFRKNTPYTGPAIPLNAFQCYLKALGNRTVKQAKVKWMGLDDDKKEKYLSMAKLDQQRFDVEMELLQLYNQKNSQANLSKPFDEQMKIDQKPNKTSKSPKSKESQMVQSLKLAKINSQIEFEKNTEIVVACETQNVVKPKKPRNSFICFVKHNQPSEEEKKEQTKAQPGRMKEYGEKWGKMTDDEKQIYVDISKKDHERFQNQMKEFNKKGTFQNAEGFCSSTMTQKSKKSPKSTKKNNFEEMKSSKSPKRSKSKLSKFDKQNHVKNPKSAYICYMNQVVGQILKDHKLSGCHEASKIVGKQWKEMSEEDKQPYYELNKADKARCQRQKQELQQHGYFTLEDGSKSTDFRNPSPKLAGKKREADKKQQIETNSLGEDECSLESQTKKQK